MLLRSHDLANGPQRIEVVGSQMNTGHAHLDGQLHDMERGDADVIEKVRVHIDTGQADQLGRRLHQQVFIRRQRRIVLGNRIQRPVHERGLVDLAVNIQFEVLDLIPVGRHHVAGQLLGDILLDLVQAADSLGGPDIGHDVFLGSDLFQANEGPQHPVLVLDLRADLAQLDAVAVELDLRVHAADVVETAVFVERHQVAAVVEAGHVDAVMLLLVGILEEHLGVQVGTVPVAVGQLHATDEQFSLLARGDQLPVRVGDVADDAGNGLADVAPVVRPLDLVRRGHDALGRAVAVDETIRVLPGDLAGEAVRNGFATGRQGVHGREIVIREDGQQGRRHEGVGDPLLLHEPVHQQRVVLLLLLDDYQGAAVVERGEDLQHGHIEVDAGELEDDGLVADIEIVRQADGLHVAVQGPVRLRDALGLAGGTGSVDHIGFGDRAAQDGQRFHQRAGEQLLEIVFGDQDGHGGILADEIPALRRRLHVDGDIGAAQLHGCQDAGHIILVPGQ